MVEQVARRPFEWMTKYTRETEWIEKQGIFLWLALVCGLGGGLYLASLFFDSLWGMFIGWLILVVGKGGFHVLFLGKPTRFLQVFLNPQTIRTSWLTRGLFFLSIFAVFGAVQMALNYWTSLTGVELAFKVLAGIFAFLSMFYPGFLLNVVRGIPFWNNGLLPILYVLCSLEGGVAIGVAMGAYFNVGINAGALEVVARIMLSSFAFMLLVYLWSARYGSSASKGSVIELTRGSASFSIPFWVGLVFLGVIIPLVLAWTPMSAELQHSMIILASVCSLISGLSLRYSLLKAGFYKPLIPLV